MAHVLIVGTTESGKTTLARDLSAHYQRNQFGVLVLDPLNDPRWYADFITDDSEDFLDVFWRSRRCIAFLDEGGESVGRYDLAMQQTATRGRHWGHSCHYVCQDPTQLAPIVRAQCSHIFAFALSSRQSKIMAEEFNEPMLETCTRLVQGEYIHAQRFGKATRNINGVKHHASISTDRNDPDRRASDIPRTETRQENSGEENATGSGSSSVASADNSADCGAGSDTGDATA